MTAVLVLALVLAVAIKTFSYGLWEIKRENKTGGIFALMLAAVNVILAVRYLVNYWT